MQRQAGKMRQMAARVDGKGAQKVAVSSIVQACVTCATHKLVGRESMCLWTSEHVRCVAQVSVDRVDRTKLDPHVATLVVVEVVTEPSGRTRYRLACDAGVITTVYNRGDIRLLPRSTPELHGLRAALEGWRGLPKVGIRAAMRALSRVTNGQGMRRCSCTGTCLKGKCACRKAGFECNSRCHPRNTRCCKNVAKQKP